ncbi:unnamed protein product [Staurois parvus]|uniref:Uncharacterized protein n=1 Tax=Staurois parvus TaxID=386267 RepID=A0ABN9BG90_9NEOB|nr:unnamed protein product [Staurois parvus]
MSALIFKCKCQTFFFLHYSSQLRSHFPQSYRKLCIF